MPNLNNSIVFTARVEDDIANDLCKIVQMPRGSLTVKCLGLPLISTKLTFKDCQPIFTKIQQKIQGWVVKKLTYGGRLQLIKSVLNGIYLHWISIFVIPYNSLRKFSCTTHPLETKKII